MLYDDTITAIATPPGEGGIGIIRLSGPEAIAIISRIFVPAKPGPLRPFPAALWNDQRSSDPTADR